MFPKVERLHMSSMITRGRERPYGLDYDVTDTPATSFVQPPRHHCCGRFNTYVLSCDAIHRSFPGLLLRVAVTSNMLTYNFELGTLNMSDVRAVSWRMSSKSHIPKNCLIRLQTNY